MHLASTCHTSVIHMSSTCHTHVIPLSSTVSHMASTRHKHVIHLTLSAPTAPVSSTSLGTAGTRANRKALPCNLATLMWRRKLNLKANFEGSSSYYSFKRLVSGVLSLGFKGPTCTALPWGWPRRRPSPRRAPPACTHRPPVVPLLQIDSHT
jgi:hypothetical protein